MIIADENIPQILIAALRNEGLEVYLIFESNRGITDIDIAALSLNPPRIILTQDNDFGRMVFEESIMVIGVVFLRFIKYDRKLLVDTVLSFFKQYSYDSLINKFVTITPEKIRVKQITK